MLRRMCCNEGEKGGGGTVALAISVHGTHCLLEGGIGGGEGSSRFGWRAVHLQLSLAQHLAARNRPHL
jgi:hypothetical protein